MSYKPIILKDETEQIRSLFKKYNLKCDGSVCGGIYRLSIPPKMDGVCIIDIYKHRCEIFDGDTYLELAINLVADFFEILGVEYIIIQHSRPTSFLTPFDHHPESIHRVFRLKDIFSDSHEFYDEIANQSIFSNKIQGFDSG